MRNSYYILFAFCFGFSLNAQIVNIPDANFKAKLISLAIDTNFDGNIQISEALDVSGLNLRNSSISDLTGISSFANLAGLDCGNNNIQTLDLTQNSNLTNLGCDHNNIQNLDLPQSLILLYCDYNQINSLLIPNTVKYLTCSHNLIQNLILPQNHLLQLDCSHNEIAILDLPQASFNNANVNCSYNQITSFNIPGYIRILDCSHNQITNLNVSIGYSLDCSYNLIETLNVGTHFNEGINEIKCDHNLIDVLDLENDRVYMIDCSFNELTSIILNSYGVKHLNCSNNLLTSIDLKTIAYMRILNCNHNQLTEIITTPGSAFQDYTINFDFSYNNLTSLLLRVNDSAGYLNVSHNQLSSLTIICVPTLGSVTNGIFDELNCSYNNLTSFNSIHIVNFPSSSKITNLNCSNNLISGDLTLPTNNIIYGKLDCSYNQITNLSLIGNNFPYYSELKCNNNLLTNLNLNQLNYLYFLDCGQNNLTSLNISFANLVYLKCSYNNLSSLDLSGCTTLDYLFCNNNNLQSLNIKNTSNESNYLDFHDNQTLQYICADNDQLLQVQNLVSSYGYANCVVGTNCNLSIDERDNYFVDYFSISPNPAKDILTIQAKESIEVSSINIYNTLGQLVLLIPNAKDISTIDVSTLRTGNYFIKVQSDKGVSSTKFIKE